MVENRGLEARLEQGRQTLLEDVNRACPGLGLPYAAETVKYTTARAVAERILDRVAAALPAPTGPCRTADVPLASAGLGVMQ